MSFLKTAVYRAGLIDEEFIGTAHRWEADLASRIWKLGYIIIHDPEAKVLHLEEPSGGIRKHKDDRMRNELFFALKTFRGKALLLWLWRLYRELVLNKQIIRRPFLLPTLSLFFLSYVFAHTGRLTLNIFRRSQ